MADATNATTPLSVLSVVGRPRSWTISFKVRITSSPSAPKASKHAGFSITDRFEILGKGQKASRLYHPGSRQAKPTVRSHVECQLYGGQNSRMKAR